MKKLFVTSFMLICIWLPSQAQISDMVYHTYELEEINSIQLNIYGDYLIEKYPGNMLRVETSINLYSANRAILDHYIKTAMRYDIEEVRTTDALTLTSTDQTRQVISTKKADCLEETQVIIYVPEEFNQTSEKVFNRETSSTVTVKKDDKE